MRCEVANVNMYVFIHLAADLNVISHMCELCLLRSTPIDIASCILKLSMNAVCRNFCPFLHRASTNFWDANTVAVAEYRLALDSLVGDYPAICDTTGTRTTHCPFCRGFGSADEPTIVHKKSIDERKRLFCASVCYHSSDIVPPENDGELAGSDDESEVDVEIGKRKITIMKRWQQRVELKYNIRIGLNPWIIAGNLDTYHSNAVRETDIFSDLMFDPMHLIYERCGYSLMIAAISLLSYEGAAHLISQMDTFSTLAMCSTCIRIAYVYIC